MGLAQDNIAKVLQLRAIVDPILSFIPRSMPHFTDHGMRHADNVLTLLLGFTKNLPKTSQPTFSFSQEELLLMACAAYLHDIGCILGRRSHNNASVHLIENNPTFAFLNEYIGGPSIHSCLEAIIVSHSSKYKFKKIPTTQLAPNVRLKLVCAIFRLLDACEISAARTSNVVFEILHSHDKIKAAELQYWEGHLELVNLGFDGDKIMIDSRHPRSRNILIEHLREDLVSINEVFVEQDFQTFNVRVFKSGFN